MIERYRSPAETPHPQASSQDAPRPQILRPLLWTLLVVSLVGNVVSSLSGAATAVHLGSGLAIGVCVVALLVQYLRRR